MYNLTHLTKFSSLPNSFHQIKLNLPIVIRYDVTHGDISAVEGALCKSYHPNLKEQP